MVPSKTHGFISNLHKAIYMVFLQVKISFSGSAAELEYVLHVR